MKTEVVMADLKDLYTPTIPILDYFIKFKGMDFILDNCL